MTEAGGKSSVLWRVGLFVLAVIAVVLLVRLLPVDEAVAALQRTVAELGWIGPIVFGLAYVAASLAFVPGSVLTLAAGAVFGLWLGIITVSLAATLAAAAAFLISRYLARERIGAMAENNSRFGAIDQAVGEGGWKIVGLLRLSPAVPFSVSNYLFGLTSIQFWPYVGVSLVAMLPGTFLYVYLGYAGRAGVSAAEDGGSRGPLEWVLLAVGLLATLAVTIYVTRLARRALRQRTDVTE